VFITNYNDQSFSKTVYCVVLEVVFPRFNGHIDVIKRGCASLQELGGLKPQKLSWEKSLTSGNFLSFETI